MSNLAGARGHSGGYVRKRVGATNDCTSGLRARTEGPALRAGARSAALIGLRAPGITGATSPHPPTARGLVVGSDLQPTGGTVTFRSTPLGTEIAAQVDRQLATQRWIVDGLKVANTFIVGAAAAVDASAWQEHGHASLSRGAAVLLAASVLVLIGIFFLSRVDEPDVDAILAIARAEKLTDDQAADRLFAESWKAAQSNARTVRWMVGLSILVAVLAVASGVLGAIVLLI